MSMQNQIASASRASRARCEDIVDPGAAAGRGGGGDHHAAEPAARGLGVDHLDATAPRSSSSAFAAIAAPTVPEMPPARWIETMSLPPASSGS